MRRGKPEFTGFTQWVKLHMLVSRTAAPKAVIGGKGICGSWSCSGMRCGLCVPHSMYYDALWKLVEVVEHRSPTMARFPAPSASMIATRPSFLRETMLTHSVRWISDLMR